MTESSNSQIEVVHHWMGVRMRSLVVCWLLVTACGGKEDTGQPPRGQQAAQDIQSTLQLAPNPNNPLSAFATVTADADTTLRLVYGVRGEDYTHATPEVPVAAGVPVELTVLGLYEGTWSVAVEIGGVAGEPASIATQTPASFGPPTTTVLADASRWAATESICASREGPPAYACTDRQGRPNLYIELIGNAMFVRPLSDGTLLAHPDGAPALWQFDTAGREIRRIDMSDLRNTTYEHGWIDEHETVEIVEGPWAGAWAILTATEEAGRIGAGIIVYDPASQQVLWDWSSHGAPGDGRSIDDARLPYDRQTLANYGNDWLHANAVAHSIDAAGTDHFWMSLRHQDWVIRIDAPSGDIRWRLGFDGDFTLVDDLDAANPVPLSQDKWMYHQHAPELRRQADGTVDMLIFDNGNVRADEQGNATYREEYSRAVTFRVDEAAMRASIVWSYGAPEPSAEWFFGEAAGDADRSADEASVLITKAVNTPTIYDIDLDGTMLWTQRFTGEGELYRSELYPSLYDIDWKAMTGW